MFETLNNMLHEKTYENNIILQLKEDMRIGILKSLNFLGGIEGYYYHSLWKII